MKCDWGLPCARDHGAQEHLVVGGLDKQSLTTTPAGALVQGPVEQADFILDRAQGPQPCGLPLLSSA